MKISCDEKICVRCLACVSESEFGGITYQNGQILFDETLAEDWATIAAICPVGAIKIITFAGNKLSKMIHDDV